MLLPIAVAVAVAVAACDAPSFQIIYDISNAAGGQTCGVERRSCADISLACDAVLSVRILSPDRPNEPHIKVCERIVSAPKQDLCSITAIKLPVKEMPKETLEVQALIWPQTAVTDPQTGELDCLRNEVTFELATGFPILVKGEQPALGGRTYFHPGQTEAVVTLGCTFLESVTGTTCIAANAVQVTAPVLDFDSGAQINTNNVTVLVGEPRPMGEIHVLEVGDAAVLPVLNATPLVWGGTVKLDLIETACIEVIEGVAQSTATLHCYDGSSFPQPKMFDLPGILLSKPTLDQIIGALQLSVFPEAGITVGMVVDGGLPVAGVSIASRRLSNPGAPPPTIQYLSADRKSVGGTATSSSGIFVSLDMPYATELTAPPHTARAIGGRVRGKVTVVLLELAPIVGT
ncbi:MAG: hypothetical protein KF773_22650 [Deltaproteobacteria bacterium]|nr:hypothetical protein [Deltaproteobacteria bacterium]MCW5808301.1 hypothetical protein [Deltaproteobacteria bacterium]